MVDLKIVALAGGVGGAKLADGLAQVLHPENLTIVVNTADDFTYLGLRISPDLDTVCYTLAGMANPETGWGRNNETWNVLSALKQMNLPDWFQIGDADIATHLARTSMMQQGKLLSQITREFCELWGIKVRVLPMSDDMVQTRVKTIVGDLAFQEYFVHRQCEPVVRGFKFEGAEIAKPALGVMDAIDQCDAVIICPSNPWVSIDPILSVHSIRSAVDKHMVVAVSPIIGNKTVKGPAAKMFSELGFEPSALEVAHHYGKLIDTMVIDKIDSNKVNNIQQLGIHCMVTNIMMKDSSDRGRLAREIIDYIAQKNIQRKS
jgi:LPPG:FO 2-phospho-L-lactate transferase